MTTQAGLMAYIAILLLTFFASSFLVARYSYESPTEPTNLLLLAGVSLVWPITVPLFMAILLLVGIAQLAKEMSDRM